MHSDDYGPVFDGRFSDGRTAASERVTAQLTRKDIVITRSEGRPGVTWPVAAIETSEPVTSRSIDVLVLEPKRAGGTLFVADGVFVRRLAEAAPHVTAGSQRWRMLRPGLLVTAAVSVIAAVLWFGDVSPARSMAKMLPDKTRVAIGKQVVQSMSGGQAVCEDTRGKEALAKLAKRLSDATGTTKTFVVSVIDSKVINAFAAPGEQIVIMSALLEKAESADEVAGVLAHEMGHGVELHPETSIIRAVGLTAITEFMLGGSGGTLANIGLMLTQLGYSRQAEKEADKQAIAILKKAEIGTQGFSDFFRRVAKMTDEKTDAKKKDASDDTFDMLRTHPSPADRLAVIEAQPKYAATPALDIADWRALKGICGEKSARKPVNKPGSEKPGSEPKKRPPEPPRSGSPPDKGRDI